MGMMYRLFNYRLADRLFWQYHFERAFGTEHMKISRTLLTARRSFHAAGQG